MSNLKYTPAEPVSQPCTLHLRPRPHHLSSLFFFFICYFGITFMPSINLGPFLNLSRGLSAGASWSVLGHVLSKEQSKDGSDGVSDDGRLTIVQCHHYHQPPSSDLYRSSVRILPLLRYHQHNLHSYHCHYQPAPCAIYSSTTRAPPCSTHIPCSRPITSRTHQFSRSWVTVTTRTCKVLHWHPSAPSRIRVSSLYVHSTTICSSR